MTVKNGNVMCWHPHEFHSKYYINECDECSKVENVTSSSGRLNGGVQVKNKTKMKTGKKIVGKWK